MKFKEGNNSGGSTDSKNYLRLKDKESVRGLFVGDPYELKAHWNGKGDDVCTEDHFCQHCSLGVKSRFRFRINFLIKEGDLYLAKIFEQGWNTYKALKSLHEGEYNLENHLVTISRHGSGPTDTEYSILPVKNGELKLEQLRNILKTPLIDLQHKKETHQETEAKSDEPSKAYFEPTPAFDDDSEIPF